VTRLPSNHWHQATNDAGAEFKIRRMSMSILGKLSVLAAVATLPLAAANVRGETQSIHVRTNDINISSAHGQKILALRVDRAAREVCDFANDRLGHQVRKIERKCRENAKASAWAAFKTDTRLGSR
jgi:UrcA family protein